MPKQKGSLSPGFESFDEDFEEDASYCSSRSNHPPLQRNAANARERARMRVLSSAFCRLKTKLPNIPPDTKLSKLDTLRLATIYIRQLKALLEGENFDCSLTTSNCENLEVVPISTFMHYTNAEIEGKRLRFLKQSLKPPSIFKEKPVENAKEFLEGSMGNLDCCMTWPFCFQQMPSCRQQPSYMPNDWLRRKTDNYDSSDLTSCEEHSFYQNNNV